jgi:beta-aspartyl-peptidase (threonine type)
MNAQRQPVSRMGLVFIVAGLAILGVLAAEIYSHAHGGPQERTRQAIEQVLQTQAADWNRGDLDAFMTGYWKSPDLSFFSDREKRGWQSLHDRYRQLYQSRKGGMGTLSFSDLEIDLLGRDSALVRGRWQVVDSKGAKRGLFTLVVRKFPEGWRIVHDHTSAEQ